MTSKDLKIAYIDFRFDYPGGVKDTNGNRINSLEQYIPELNHLKEIGFNTISLGLQAPIDLRNGLINLGTRGTASDKNPPIDTWKIVDYAHSIGLSVFMEVMPSVSNFSDGKIDTSDLNLMLNQQNQILGSGVTPNIVLNSVAAYEKALASLFQEHNIEGMYIGHANAGYDTDSALLSIWSKLITDIKSVFSGRIMYQSYWDNSLWGLLETVNLNVNPLISKTPTHILSNIVEGYYHAIGGIAREDSPTNYIDFINKITLKYSGKDLILDEYSQYAVDQGVGNTVVPFSYANSNSSIDSFPTPDKLQQKLAYQAFIYVSHHLINNSSTGIGLTEYNPLYQYLNDPLWKWLYTAGDHLWGNTYVEDGIKDAFTKNILENYSFSTPGNDYLKGLDKNTNTAVFYCKLGEAKVIKSENNFTIISPFDGTDSLENIQRVQFSDFAISYELNGSAGTIMKTLGAVFGKDSIKNKEYAGIGLDLLDKGMSYDTLAGLALSAAKASTNDQIVTTLWTNIVGSAPSTADKAPFIKMLEDGMAPGTLARIAADSSINTTNINLVGLAQTGIEYTPFV